jgi:malate synthase
MATTVSGVEITGAMEDGFDGVLTDEAVAFVAELHRRFDGRRRELLAAREERMRELEDGGELDFLPETREIREGEWQVAPPPPDLRRRRVEITGPTDAKMVINALNSGADGFMTDFEDSNSPTWHNMIQGQINLSEAIEGALAFEDKGK